MVMVDDGWWMVDGRAQRRLGAAGTWPIMDGVARVGTGWWR